MYMYIIYMNIIVFWVVCHAINVLNVSIYMYLNYIYT